MSSVWENSTLECNIAISLYNGYEPKGYCFIIIIIIIIIIRPIQLNQI